jgi:lysine 2,3-aminomutase
MDNNFLDDLFRSLRDVQPSLLFRICTRVPITEPLRLDDETIALFAKYRPLRISAHINHPRELCCLSSSVLASCVSVSIPVLVQTVLMRGINDEPSLLAELFGNCLDLGLSPYYLFQMDLAPGTAHFRVPLEQGLAIYRELSGLISDRPNKPLGLPAYALDLPGGGGKIRLHENVIVGKRLTPNGPVYVLKDKNGSEWCYPV